MDDGNFVESISGWERVRLVRGEESASKHAGKKEREKPEREGEREREREGGGREAHKRSGRERGSDKCDYKSRRIISRIKRTRKSRVTPDNRRIANRGRDYGRRKLGNE